MKDMYMKVRDEHIETLKKFGALQKEHTDKVNTEHAELVAQVDTLRSELATAVAQCAEDAADMMCTCCVCANAQLIYSMHMHGVRERTARHRRTI
jgi:hypothetical protein